MNPQTIITTCQNDLPNYAGSCNGFVIKVDADLGFSDFAQNDTADSIVAKLESSANWRRLADGVAAKNAADAGGFVLGGLKVADFSPPTVHGHIVVVVSGPLANSKYPMAFWGNLGGPPSDPSGQTVNYAFLTADRDNVEYFART